MKRLFSQTIVFLSKIVKAALVISVFLAIYLLGYFNGYFEKHETGDFGIIQKPQDLATIVVKSFVPPPTPTQIPIPSEVLAKGDGPQLWELVNRRRDELGTGELTLDEKLCTIASLRLNELIKLGELDAHEGFNTLRDRRPDLVHILDSYPNMAEFLAQGGQTPAETLNLWEGTLGHRALVTNSDFAYGCIYSQDTFAVAITAF